MSINPHVIEGVKARQPESKPPWGWITLIVAMLVGTAILFSPLARKIKSALLTFSPQKSLTNQEEADIERQVEARMRAEFEEQLAAQIRALKEKPLPTPQPEEPPIPRVETESSSSGGNIRMLRSGIPFHSSVLTENGGLASIERTKSDSYKAEYKLLVKVPKAAQSLDELKKNSADIDLILPKLAKLLEKSLISPEYSAIYQNKITRIKKDATQLNELLSKHNFYDLETILHIRDPETSRRVFFMQSEMDVVSDGSDGDRLATMPASIVESSNYQPFTSYGWKKQTAIPNPMIAGWEKRIVSANEELALPQTSAPRKQWLKERIVYLQRGIDDMKSRSFLVAEYDPFIVIPVHMLTANNDPYAPRIGDYAVVIYDKKVYPAIVGDGGPTFKVGEASLRMAMQLNPSATPYNRPVSDLKVTYLVFPNSREAERSAPDYAKWKNRCEELLKEIGGLGEGYSLYEWEDKFPKP